MVADVYGWASGIIISSHFALLVAQRISAASAWHGITYRYLLQIIDVCQSAINIGQWLDQLVRTTNFVLYAIRIVILSSLKWIRDRETIQYLPCILH